MFKESKLYCSLDIETTGFDPLKDEILEIGFVFFTIEKETLRLGKTYSRLFQTKQPVSEIILGLTGIQPEALATGAKLDEHLSEIQELVKDAVIVGHNINFDLGFLKNLGLQFQEGEIDTLDLAQFILPTHQSYNLENLMHYFGIPHTEAHRALADAQATVKVLEGLLRVFAGFPVKLKRAIWQIAEQQKFVWADCLKHNWVKLSARQVSTGIQPKNLKSPVLPKINAFTNYNLQQDYNMDLAKQLKEQNKPYLLVVPGSLNALSISEHTAVELVCSPENGFDAQKFLMFQQKTDLTPEEAKFIMKILVWQNTNWQQTNLADLNLSFFGGQYKSQINGKLYHPAKLNGQYVCDYETFTSLNNITDKSKLNVIFSGLSELEQSISGRISRKISWGRISYLLKNIYNPETAVGNVAYKALVENALSDTDLFFGLTSALLQTNPPGFLTVKISELAEEKLEKIRLASENYSNKLKVFAQGVQNAELDGMADALLKFFAQEANMVKWLELSANTCTFIKSPVEIKHLASEIFQSYKSISLVDCLPEIAVWRLYQARLGLDDFTFEVYNPEHAKDLFSFLKFKSHIQIDIYSEALSEDKILEQLSVQALPGAVLFGNALEVKNFYFKHFSHLQEFAFIHPQLGSSGNKILRNFSIHQHSLLLASDKFILKALASANTAKVIGKLKVKTLVIGHLPFEQFTHPYMDAVAKSFNNSFEEYSLPKALFNLHKLVSLFFTDSLKRIIIYEDKLNKPYAKLFLEYFTQYLRKTL